MNTPKNGAFAATAIVAAMMSPLATAGNHNDTLAGDTNSDQRVDTLDLLAVISEMGRACPATPETCPTDLNGSDHTSVDDLIVVLVHWGDTAFSNDDDTDGDEDDSTDIDDSDPQAEERLVGPDPIVMDSVYFDAYSRDQARADLGIDLDQGWQTRNWNQKNGIAVTPYAYSGGVDFNNDMQYTQSDLENFANWLDENVPYDYDGPVCLDMEGEWWHMMTWANQEQMDEIMDFYIEGLEYAKEMRPNAQFGYWGLPKKNMTADDYNGPSVERLLNASDVIFPDTYENNPGGNDSLRLEKHVERCIEMVNGEIPVHVQMCPRHKDNELGGWRHYHTNEEFIRDQARPALEAKWTDAEGNTHRVAGIAIWDAYVYAANFHDDWNSLSEDEIVELWDEIDDTHLSLYQELAELVTEYAAPRDNNSGPGTGSQGGSKEIGSQAASAGPASQPAAKSVSRPTARKQIATKGRSKLARSRR